jgi:hypothetical protein
VRVREPTRVRAHRSNAPPPRFERIDVRARRMENDMEQIQPGARFAAKRAATRLRAAALVFAALSLCTTGTTSTAQAEDHSHHHHEGGSSEATPESADGHAHHGPGHAGHGSGHAPIGVMGDHIHARGEWMLSYRYMRMDMSPNLVGSDEVSASEIVASPGPYEYMVSPVEMDMNMHMFGLMYAPFDKVTLMAMIPFITKSMDHVTRPGGAFTTESQGVGDLKLSVLYQPWKNEHHSVHFQLGFSSPTGSIDETDVTPMSGGAAVQMPYPMQIGSGTFGLLFGGTYNGHRGRVSWGGQVSAVVWLGTNDNDYRLGDEYEITSWAAYNITAWASGSFRIAWAQNFNIDGADPALNPMMVPTADPNLRAGRHLDALFGLNLDPSAVRWLGFMGGTLIGVEGGLPMYQNLDGPQLGEAWQITAGIQYAF